MQVSHVGLAITLKRWCQSNVRGTNQDLRFPPSELLGQFSESPQFTALAELSCTLNVA